MKKLIIITLALSFFVLTSCFFNDDDDNNNNPSTESFLTANIWYFNDTEATLEITTNSNQTAYNIFDEADGGITIEFNDLSKRMDNIKLSYFHYVYHGQDYSGLSLENLAFDYPYYWFSYSFNTYSGSPYESMSFDYSLNDSTYYYYSKHRNDYLNDNVFFDTTQYKLTVSNDIYLPNAGKTDSVKIKSGSIEVKKVSVSANTPKELNLPVMAHYTTQEMKNVSLQFISDGTLIETDLGYENNQTIDSSKWELDGNKLIIIDDGDTNTMSAYSNNGKLEVIFNYTTRIQDLHYTENDLHLDKGSLIKAVEINKMIYGKNALNKNVSLPKRHYNRPENEMKQISRKSPIERYRLSNKLFK